MRSASASFYGLQVVEAGGPVSTRESVLECAVTARKGQHRVGEFFPRIATLSLSRGGTMKQETTFTSEKLGGLLVQQRRAAGTKALRPPAQQDEMLAQLANPLLHRIRRQKIIRSVLAFIRREGGRTSTRHTKTSQKRGYSFCYREPDLLTCHMSQKLYQGS